MKFVMLEFDSRLRGMRGDEHDIWLHWTAYYMTFTDIH